MLFNVALSNLTDFEAIKKIHDPPGEVPGKARDRAVAIARSAPVDVIHMLASRSLGVPGVALMPEAV